MFSSWYCHGGFFPLLEVEEKLYFFFQENNVLGCELAKQECKQKG